MDSLKKWWRCLIDVLIYYFKIGNDYIFLVEIIFSVVKLYLDLKCIVFLNLCKNVVYINCL